MEKSLKHLSNSSMAPTCPSFSRPITSNGLAIFARAANVLSHLSDFPGVGSVRHKSMAATIRRAYLSPIQDHASASRSSFVFPFGNNVRLKFQKSNKGERLRWDYGDKGGPGRVLLRADLVSRPLTWPRECRSAPSVSSVRPRSTITT